MKFNMKKILLILVVVVIAGALVLWWQQSHKIVTGPTPEETARALDRLSGPAYEEQPLTPKQKQAINGLSAQQEQKSEAEIKAEEEALRLLQGN